jgi:hypothetical protein
MRTETGLLTSQSTQEVLDWFYLDPRILSAIELGSLKIKAFGEDSSRSFLTQKKKGLRENSKSLIIRYRDRELATLILHRGKANT